jgi:hypothetical protein
MRPIAAPAKSIKDQMMFHLGVTVGTPADVGRPSASPSSNRKHREEGIQLLKVEQEFLIPPIGRRITVLAIEGVLKLVEAVHPAESKINTLAPRIELKDCRPGVALFPTLEEILLPFQVVVNMQIPPEGHIESPTLIRRRDRHPASRPIAERRQTIRRRCRLLL